MNTTPKDSLGFSVFGFAIQRPDGKFYNGKANLPIDQLFTDTPMNVYTYTERAAYQKIATFPCFKDCKVIDHCRDSKQ